MGNYFSGNKQSSLDNVINEDCSVNIFVDKKSLNENIENTNIIGGDNQEEPVITQEEPDIDFVNKTPEPEVVNTSPEPEPEPEPEPKPEPEPEPEPEPKPEPEPEPEPEPKPELEPEPEDLEPIITGGSVAGSDIDTSVNGGDYSNDDDTENNISTTSTSQSKNKKRRNKKKKNNVPVI
jgi:outer membrane biosynthesis protein TonB